MQESADIACVYTAFRPGTPNKAVLHVALDRSKILRSSVRSDDTDSMQESAVLTSPASTLHPDQAHPTKQYYMLHWIAVRF